MQGICPYGFGLYGLLVRMEHVVYWFSFSADGASVLILIDVL